MFPIKATCFQRRQMGSLSRSLERWIESSIMVVLLCREFTHSDTLCGCGYQNPAAQNEAETQNSLFCQQIQFSTWQWMDTSTIFFDMMARHWFPVKLSLLLSLLKITIGTTLSSSLPMNQILKKKSFLCRLSIVKSLPTQMLPSVLVYLKVAPHCTLV